MNIIPKEYLNPIIDAFTGSSSSSSSSGNSTIATEDESNKPEGNF